jgi:hypothetical protein
MPAVSSQVTGRNGLGPLEIFENDYYAERSGLVGSVVLAE